MMRLQVKQFFFVKAVNAEGISSVQVFAIENEPPIARFIITSTEGDTSLTITLDANGSNDSDGSITSYAWSVVDYVGKLVNDFSEHNVVSNFSLPKEAVGHYIVTLTVTDNKGGQDTFSIPVLIMLENSFIKVVRLASLSFDSADSYNVVGDTITVKLIPEGQDISRSEKVDLWVAVSIPDNDNTLLFLSLKEEILLFDQIQAFKTSLESSTTENTTVLKGFDVEKGLEGTYTFFGLYVKEREDLTKYLSKLDELWTIQRSNIAIQQITISSPPTVVEE